MTREELKPHLANFTLRELELLCVEAALEKHKQNRTISSRALGVSLKTVRNKIKLMKKREVENS